MYVCGIKCMYAETPGCMYAEFGCMYAEAVGCMYAVVGCKVCGNSWVQSMRLLRASLTTAVSLSDSR